MATLTPTAVRSQHVAIIDELLLSDVTIPHLPFYYASAYSSRRLDYSISTVVGGEHRVFRQWRRQNLLRGGAKLGSMSWGTHANFKAGYTSCSLTTDNSSVTNAVMIEKARVADICAS